MNLNDLKYLKRRLSRIRETSTEINKELKKNKGNKWFIAKFSVMEDLKLEIDCYTREMSKKLGKIEKDSNLMKGGKNG